MFNLTNVSSDDFKPLPAGVYRAFVFECEFKETRTGTGEYLKITFKVLDERYEGRLVWEMINLVNSNPKAVEIGLKSLVKLLSALGHDTSTLANVEKHEILSMIDQKEIFIKLKIIVDDYGEKNRVVSFLPVDLNVTTSVESKEQTITDSDIPF